MNQTLETLLNRKSVRAYEDRPISADAKAEILQATLRAPTAGNMMLYSGMGQIQFDTFRFFALAKNRF